MNKPLNDPRHPWSRLTTAARTVREDGDAAAPYGFATRVAALAFAQEGRVASMLERFALRAVGVATLLALFSVALNYQALSPVVSKSASSVSQVEETDLVPADDAVAVVLDLAD